MMAPLVSGDARFRRCDASALNPRMVATSKTDRRSRGDRDIDGVRLYRPPSKYVYAFRLKTREAPSFCR